MSDKNGTRNLILEAVVTCIEKYGIDKVTTRKIAVEAGTNIASINYYFRSKDQLIEEAMSMTINHMLEDVSKSMDDTGQSFEAILSNIFFYLLDGCLLFPGISRAHLYKIVMEKDYASTSAQTFRKVFERLVDRATQAYPAIEPKQVRLRISQILSSLMFVMLAPDFLPVAREFRLTSSKNARSLAESYAAMFASDT
jgi:TetR/AcrR family transcriptional regulator, regulator of cefoperazone and chloramphenicol sensitivity